MPTSELVYVGTVDRAWGVNGEIKVSPTSREGHSLLNIKDILIGPSPQETKPYQVARARTHGKFVLLAIELICNPEQANLLKKQGIYVPRTALPKTQEGEYYYCDLEGLEVYHGKKKIGVIKEIMALGGVDVYVIDDGKRELMIPATKEVIKKIDLEGKRMEVELLEGMEE